MAASDLPDVKRKQKILFNDDTAPEVWIQQGQRFFEAGWFNDAIDFWDRAGHKEGLEQLRRTAREQGDVFLFNRCLKALEAEADEGEWRQVAGRAEAQGKLQFAREAYRMAGDRKAMDRVDARIAPPAQAEEPERPAGGDGPDEGDGPE